MVPLATALQESGISQDPFYPQTMHGTQHEGSILLIPPTSTHSVDNHIDSKVSTKEIMFYGVPRASLSTYPSPSSEILKTDGPPFEESAPATTQVSQSVPEKSVSNPYQSLNLDSQILSLQQSVPEVTANHQSISRTESLVSYFSPSSPKSQPLSKAATCPSSNSFHPLSTAATAITIQDRSCLVPKRGLPEFSEDTSFERPGKRMKFDEIIEGESREVYAEEIQPALCSDDVKLVATELPIAFEGPSERITMDNATPLHYPESISPLEASTAAPIVTSTSEDQPNELFHNIDLQLQQLPLIVQKDIQDEKDTADQLDMEDEYPSDMESFIEYDPYSDVIEVCASG